MTKVIFAAFILVKAHVYAQNNFPSNGNVGIGTNSPFYTLEVVNNGVGTNQNAIVIRSNNPNEHWPLAVQTNGLNNWSGLFGINNDVSLYLRNSTGQLNALINSEGDSYLNGGNLGIGTIDPYYPLEVVNNVIGTNQNAFVIRSNNPDEHWPLSIQTNGMNNWSGLLSRNDNLSLYLRNGLGQLNVLVNPNGDSYLNGGKVGIGTSAPDATLAVKGNIHAEEVRVDLNVPGPDYVFGEDYDLPTLESTQNYIRENKHLPGLPTAKEMEEDGIDLGVMNMILLKKVEELTLYTIHQEGKIKQLEEKNRIKQESLKNEISELRQLITGQE